MIKLIPLLEKIYYKTWYHGTNSEWTDKHHQRVTYWVDDKKIAHQYGRNIKSFQMPASEYYELPTYDAEGAEWDLESGKINQIERALIKGEPLDIWGQVLNITPDTKYVLVTNIVDPPDGHMDVSNDDFYANNHKYSADILIQKL